MESGVSGLDEPYTLETLLTQYGHLAAELDETADPTRAEWLTDRLHELDGVLDRLVTRVEQEANAREELADS
jgi:hypothetical protein